MTDSIDTSDREAEDPREPIRLPVREMRDEPAPQRAAQEGDLPPPHGFLYDWTHSSATGRTDEEFTGFSYDEAQARRHEAHRNVRAVYTAEQMRLALAAAGGGVPQANSIQRRAANLHIKACMPWSEAEQLALSEAGIDDKAIDELIGECGYMGLESLLTTPDELRQFTRSVLVHQPLASSPQPEAAPAVAQADQSGRGDDWPAELSGDRTERARFGVVVDSVAGLWIDDDDFIFDASIKVDGDFPDDATKRKYLDEIVRRLNGRAPATYQAGRGGQGVLDSEFIHKLLWGEYPECCGNPVVGAEYMGQEEMVCCGCPEPSQLSDAQIVAALRERFPEAAAPEAPAQRCPYCDDTGDVHTPTGEWRGRCTCPAGTEAPAQPHKLPIPPAPADPLEVVYVEGWNAACDAFFGGKPAPEPVVITVEAPPQAAQSAGEVEQTARPIHELPSVERDEAIRAFEAAHGDRFAADLPSDRAWVEGYAHARAALSHKEPQR